MTNCFTTILFVYLWYQQINVFSFRSLWWQTRRLFVYDTLQWMYLNCILLCCKTCRAFKSVKLKMMFLYKWFQCLFVVFLLQTKCIVLKVICCWLLLPKWSMLWIFLNHHHHHHPYMKIDFIFSANNKQECRYKLIHVEHHGDHCFPWHAVPSDNRLPHTFDGKFFSSIQLLQVG